MSFRKVGGVQYSGTQNIVKSRYNTSDNLYVSQYVGQPNTFINFLSDISGNQIYGNLDVSGNLYVGGNIDCSGNENIDGDLYVGGNIDVSGNITANYMFLSSGTNYTTDPNGVVPKSYVDAISSGLKPTTPCQLATAATSAPITSLSGLLTIDGIPTQIGYRVLVNNQGYDSSNNSNSPNINNGIYDVSSGFWSRASDCNGNDVTGQATYIEDGSSNHHATFIQIQSTATAGTDPLLYQKFNTFDLELGEGLEYINSNTIQVKSNLSDPAFIQSLVVTGDVSFNNVTVGKGGGNILTNIAVGYQALYINTDGSNNVAIGYLTLDENTSGSNNTSIGYKSLHQNSTGLDNTGLGYLALSNNIIGTKNVAVGSIALDNSNGDGNTAIGYASLTGIASGSNNTAVGLNSGVNLSGNSNFNTFLGAQTDISSNSLIYNKSTAIGYNAIVDASNQMVFGTSTEKIKIPGSYVGIGGVYNPTSNVTLDVSGNSNFSRPITMNGSSGPDRTIQSTQFQFIDYTTKALSANLIYQNGGNAMIFRLLEPGGEADFTCYNAGDPLSARNSLVITYDNTTIQSTNATFSTTNPPTSSVAIPFPDSSTKLATTAWVSANFSSGGGSATSISVTDTSNNITYYPTFVDASGSSVILRADIGSTPLTYNPSSGALNVSGVITNTVTQPASTDSSTKVPTTAWVQSAISGVGKTVLYQFGGTSGSSPLLITIPNGVVFCDIFFAGIGGAAGVQTTSSGNTYFGGSGGGATAVMSTRKIVVAGNSNKIFRIQTSTSPIGGLSLDYSENNGTSYTKFINCVYNGNNGGNAGIATFGLGGVAQSTTPIIDASGNLFSSWTTYSGTAGAPATAINTQPSFVGGIQYTGYDLSGQLGCGQEITGSTYFGGAYITWYYA